MPFFFHPIISLFGRKINLLDEIKCKFFKQTGETSYKHENSTQFPCLYHIPRFSTAFSVKLIHLSAKTANILLLFTFPFYTITETPDFCVKVYFCLIVRFFPLSPSYQRHPKTKKLGPTTHRDEPHQALKTLILSHSPILLPVNTQNPMASFGNSRLCSRQPCDRHPER